jgi:pilus assembly protein Flp/PilA
LVIVPLYHEYAFIFPVILYFTGRTARMVYGFFVKEEGQGLVEYGLILVLIMVVVVAVVTLLGGKVSDMYSSINSGLG